VQIEWLKLNPVKKKEFSRANLPHCQQAFDFLKIKKQLTNND